LALEPLTSTSIFKEFLTSVNIIKKRSINSAIFPINKIWRLLSDSFKKLLSINVKKVIKPMNKVIKNNTMMNIFFLTKLVSLILILTVSAIAVDISIIPVKKPILDKETQQQKLTQGIIKPKPKPIKEQENKKLSKEIIKPENKRKQKIKVLPLN